MLKSWGTAAALLSLVALFHAPGALGQHPPAGSAEQSPTGPGEPASDHDAIEGILTLMDDATRIATATRMNADYVPGMLTVLQGSDLEARGLRTVAEALATVPGVDIGIGPGGGKSVVVRGSGASFASSTLKFMLNGVVLNNSLSGSAGVVLDIPTEQVERIEFIRGPGAVSNGEYASVGVVNVITRTNTSRVFLRAGSANSLAGGGTLVLERPADKFGMSLNIAGWKAGDPGVTSAADRWTGTRWEYLSDAPGPTNEEHQNLTGVYALHFRGFAFSAQYSESRFGDYFGVYNTLPDESRGKVQDEGRLALDAAQELSFSRDAAATLRLGWRRGTRGWEGERLPAGIRIMPEGLIERVSYAESKLYGAADFWVKVNDAHTLQAGLGASETEVTEASLEENGEALAWIGDGTDRRLADVYLQGELAVTERFAFSGGLRYDSYDDVGGRLAPRVAAVYHLPEPHLFKLQYAEASRPPTFIEREGFGPGVANHGLEPEHFRTYEAGYIFKTPASDLRLTLFHSTVEHLIVSSPVAGGNGISWQRYENSGHATFVGGELEAAHRFGRVVTVDANVSYVETEAEASETGREIRGAANWLANLTAAWHMHRRVSLVACAHHVGDSERVAGNGDARGDFQGYDTVDLVLNLFDLPFTGLTVRAGVKNLFDADVRSKVNSEIYPDDLPRPGRQGWLQVASTF